MAGRALAGHHTLRSGVRKPRCRERTSGCVTGIAREIRRDMVGRLGQPRPARDVTGRAATRHYSDMGKAGAHPRGGAMTGVARCIGGRVIRRLALGNAAIMALTTLVRYYAGVTEKSDTP